MIQIEEVSKSYGTKKVVDQLNLTIPDGQITGFLGPNGAGKTTTIDMICGIRAMDEGEIRINGYDIEKEAIQAKQSLALVTDDPDRFTSLTGLEYIDFICNIYQVDPAVRPGRMEELLASFKMEEAVDDVIESYSHGMRQKIHIIAALMHDPRVWILDEPMVGLDPESSYLLKRMMRAHADKGNTVFFSTHVLEVAEELCDRIALIDKGVLYYSGSLEDLKAQYPGLSLEDIFLTVTGSEVYKQEKETEGENAGLTGGED